MADVKELNINNSTYDIKAKSVVDNNSGSVKFWTGTQAEYDALPRQWYAWTSTYNDNTIYTQVPYDENVNPDVYDSNFDLIDPDGQTNEFYQNKLWYYWNDGGAQGVRNAEADIFPTANSNTLYICKDTGNAYFDSKLLIEANVEALIRTKADYNFSNVQQTANIKMAHNAMPSNTYTDLILGASGTTYTAPADGFISFSAQASSNNNTYVTVAAGEIYQSNSTFNLGMSTSVLVPVKKGDVATIYYYNVNVIQFRFIYAVGSESEAV